MRHLVFVLVLLGVFGFNASAQGPASLAPRVFGSQQHKSAVAGEASARGTAGNSVRITFTFATAPASATARVAPMLYNKSRVLQFEEDDSSVKIFTDAYPLLHGGVASTGQVCPGLHFTDGCGNSRAYTAAVAINGHNSYNNAVWLDAGSQHDPNKLVWAQAQMLLDHGWDIENHSDLHTGTNPAQQLATLDALIASHLRGYQPSVCIVPTNYAGYPTAAFAAGYLAVSSASQGDNFPMVNLYNNNRVPLSTLPAPATSFVYRRANADAYSGETPQQTLDRLKSLSDALMAPGTAGEVYLQRVFAHSIDFSVLSGWLNYTHDIAQDQLWVTTLREFGEYRRVRSQVGKTETLSGNVLTVDLDYTNVSANTRFQNLTLLVDSPGTLTTIAVTGADSSTFNTATKMVNVFLAQGLRMPLPVQLTAFTARREGAGVRLAWHTASEVRAQQFQVERSADGRAFMPVGSVAAAGTSFTPRTYAFFDAAAPASTSWYYRLVQLDTDGASSYGPLVLVPASTGLSPQLWVPPNPAQAGGGLRVTVAGCAGHSLLVQLTDVVGRVVLAQPVQPTTAQQEFAISLPSGLQAGAYTLRVTGGAQLLHTRVLLTP